MPRPPKYELVWFMVNYEEEQPVVRANVRWNDTFGTEPTRGGLDFVIPESELDVIAQAAGRDNWTGNDIITWFAQQKGEQIARVSRRVSPQIR